MVTDDRHRREQLRHDVASVIREQILSRKVRPGEILRLGPIAHEMDISITPVREALLLLAQDGWVVQEPNRGFRVTSIRRRDVEDIYSMWGFAEGEISARAVQRASTAQLQMLVAMDQELQAVDEDGPQGLELNRRLHALLHQIADAPKLVWFTDAARRMVPLEFWFKFDRVPGWREFNRTSHSEIIDALVRRDAAAARLATNQHFLATCELLLDWLDSIAFWADDDVRSSGDELSPQR